MAIIIVAIFITVIALGSYVLKRILFLRKCERNFYDIFSLMSFFEKLEELDLWQDFLRDAETITVIRREPNEREEIDKKLSPNKYICYDFCFGNQKYSVYQEIIFTHRRIRKMIFIGSYRCKIDLSRKKMFFYESFDRKIFIDSFVVAGQTLKLVFEKEEMRFNSEFDRYKNLSKEIRETINWVHEQRNIFLVE